MLKATRRFVSRATILLLISASSYAGSITINDFSGSESIEDFSGLGSAPATGPFSYGGMTFSESSTGSGGPGWRLLFDSVLTDNAGISDISISFDTAYQRIGFDLFGFNSSATTYEVSFFNTASELLGTETVMATGSVGIFVGWEDLLGIASINILELSDNGHVGGVDNIRFEGGVSSVPIPAAAWLLGSGILGLIGFSRRKTAA